MSETPIIDGILKWFPLVFAGIIGLAFVGFVIVGIKKFLRQRRRQEELRNRPRGHFVFAKILDQIYPMERAEKYEDPLNESLQQQNLGMVTGGGTQMDKNNVIEWVGIDLELNNLEGAVEFTRQRLRDLGVPAGSVLEFRRGEEKVSIPIK